MSSSRSSQTVPLSTVIHVAPPSTYPKWDGTGPLRTFKGTVTPFFDLNQYDKYRQALSFRLGEVVTGSAYKVILRLNDKHQRAQERAKKDGTTDPGELTIADIWKELESVYGGEKLQESRIAAALSEIAEVRFRSPYRRHESPIDFVERIRDLMSQAEIELDGPTGEQYQLHLIRQAFSKSPILNGFVLRSGWPKTFLELTEKLQTYLTMQAQMGKVVGDFGIPSSAAAQPPPPVRETRQHGAPAAVAPPAAPQRVQPDRARTRPDFYRPGAAHLVDDLDGFEDLQIEGQRQDRNDSDEMAYYTNPPPAAPLRPTPAPAGRGQPTRILYNPPCDFMNRETGQRCLSEAHTTRDHLITVRVHGELRGKLGNE